MSSRQLPIGRHPIRRPRVGHIEFLNCLPLSWGLGRIGSHLRLQLTVASPDRLSESLVTGQLDISPISAFEFLRHASDLIALSGIAIGCDGPVMSCLIISTVPLEDLGGATVALGSTSRTSVQLARLLLRDVIGVSCHYVTWAPDLESMLRVGSAAVIIGDSALRAADAAIRRGYFVYDLGQMWRDWTGLPFVFAVFAVRRSYLDCNAEIVDSVHNDLLAARDLALAEIDEICREVAMWDAVDETTLRQYYTSALDFSFDQRQRQGLIEFAHRVAGAEAGFAADLPFDVVESALPEPTDLR
ncbi:menaquinone biosynthetic enzyme MqnA/MqnD family protein [Nocardia sp. CDC160]|uniref:menaquinone biosynthetic enzyme MqnA/MqnD family protein n=1 Tax=Nocardia sp. CDC160 TaxID=3112166 RepID=UPI002DBF4715|nr:menaquinone biosynthesis protein [Nocardia sp. CDC160]MEC3920318.1 menaquinone biosynthesis protein [Nocardia sp. CDC160]